MSLICWLPLNQDLHNQGISNLIKANVTAATVLENDGKIGKCYTNTGTTASVATPLILNTIAFSACAWVRINTSRANWGRAFGMSGTNTYFGLGCEHSNGTLLGFHFYKTIDGTNTGIFDSYPTSKQVGTWVHYAMTYDGEKAYLYENGNLLNTSTIAAARKNTRCEMTNLYLFGGTSGNYSQCSLNDVRIYDHCLSAAEVKEIAQGLILHYKMDGSMSGSGENLFTNTNRWYTATSAAFATTTGYPSVSFTKDLQQLVGKTICFSFELYTPGTRTNGSGNLGNRFGAHLSLNYTPSGGSATQAYPCAAHLTDTITEEHYRVSSTYTVPSNCTINSFGMSIQPQAKPGDDNTATWKIGQFKVEFGNAPTGYSPAPIDFGMNGTTIEDSSGFGNIGTAVGNLTTSNDTSRYSVSTYVGTTSKDYISTPNLLFENMKQGTVNIWIKRKSTDSTWRLYTFFANGYNWTGNSSDFIIIGSTGGQAIVLDCCSNTYSFTPDLNKWYMYTISWNLETHQAWMYVNGELKATKNSANIDTTYASKHNGHYFGNSHSEVGDYLMSDARIYCTPLLDTDIKQLYNVGMKIDKSHNIHTYELHQENENKLHKTGVLSNSNFNEINNLFNLLYDKQLYIEPDGSCWIRIFHHANCDTKLFTSSDTFTTSVYKDADRWFNVSLCNKVNKWELMVKSMPTTGGTETKYRWIQTKNPMTATYADVAAASVTKITGNGYASYGWGGLYHIGSSTYLATNNGTSGNWWGAVGAWGHHQGGIPGWTTVITTGYEDVYLRIDNLDQVNLHAKNIKAGMWTANQFIEK